jgi:hypothetical protein
MAETPWGKDGGGLVQVVPAVNPDVQVSCPLPIATTTFAGVCADPTGAAIKAATIAAKIEKQREFKITSWFMT